jgi:predicted amidohydrolase
MTLIRIAAAQYGLEALPCFDDYALKQRVLVEQAKRVGADLVLFPEYASLEMTAWQPDAMRLHLRDSLHGLQDAHADFLSLWQNLAREFDLLIVAPSFPLAISNAISQHSPQIKYVNRAHVLAPNTNSYQDKLIMTRFERENWGISAGSERRVFAFRGVKFAIAICYDSEFPLLARDLAEAGAELMLVPSCTDSWAGFHRVRTGCLARALENQIAVVQAPLVGHADFQPAIDINVGRAGFYLPMDTDCPDNGVLAQGDGQTPWLIQDIDLALLAHVRAQGQVLTYKHWREQLRPSLSAPVLCELAY